MEETKQSPGVTIEGRQYQLPFFHTITVDEERIMYVLADCLVRDFIPAHPEWDDAEKLKYRRLQFLRERDPNLKKALIVIAVGRAEPVLSSEERMEKAGRANAIEADIAMLWEDDDGPPEVTSQQPLEKETSTNELSNGTVTGRTTKNSSDQEGKSLEPTGTSESGTSSHSAPQIASVN